MNDAIKLLDHGMVRLVDHMGSDVSVVRAARVSYDAAWRAGENEGSDKKLIKYLWRNKHTTPFEATAFTLEVRAPISVLRQWHRHRTQAYNELSASYRDLPEVFYVPHIENIGVQSKSNKQRRDLGRSLWSESARRVELEYYVSACEQSFATYRALIKAGWPRELARNVLPMGTYTHQFATMNLLNLFKFITLRADPHAQYEIRVYAEAMLELIRPLFPVCVEAYEADRAWWQRLMKLDQDAA